MLKACSTEHVAHVISRICVKGTKQIAAPNSQAHLHSCMAGHSQHAFDMSAF